MFKGQVQIAGAGEKHETGTRVNSKEKLEHIPQKTVENSIDTFTVCFRL